VPASRTIAIARFLRTVQPSVFRRRGGRMPRQQQPDAIRLEYFNSIMPLIREQTRHLRAAGNEALRLLYEERRAQGKMDIAERGRRAMAAVDLAGERSKDAFRPSAVAETAEKYGKRTSAFQREQLGRQVQQALGIPLLSIERPIVDALPAFAAENVSLVKTVSERYHDRLRAAVEDAFESGEHPETLAKRLVDMEDISESDARRIARDQIGKLNANLNQARQESIGVTSYVWRTANDNRVRDEHQEREGQTFRWDAPPEDGHPGEPIQCRCYSEPVLDDLISGVSSSEEPALEEAMAEKPASSVVTALETAAEFAPTRGAPPPGFWQLLPEGVSVHDIAVAPRPGMEPPTLKESNAKRVKDPWSGRWAQVVDVSSLDDVPAAVWQPERANRIARAYQEGNGERLPPIRIAVTASGKRTVVDGMHRLSVARQMGVRRIAVIFER